MLRSFSICNRNVCPFADIGGGDRTISGEGKEDALIMSVRGQIQSP
jgi:hypothetical protein